MTDRTCSHCERPSEKRGMCSTHYSRWRNGRDMDMPIRKQRRYGAPFWESVQFTESCWLWTGAINSDGYGTALVSEKAHRVAWQMVNGPIPDGLHVLHHCDVRHCVNPDHLFLGTNADNVADKLAKNRHRRGEASPRACLTECDVQAIRQDSRDNATIGREYGVTTTTIWQIKHRVRWQHI